MSVHQKPDGRWYVYWRDEAGQHTKSFGRGEEGRSSAEGYDRRRSGDLLMLLKDFEGVKKVEGVSEAYLKEVGRLGKIVAGEVNKPLNRITYLDVAQVMGKFGKGSPTTVNRYMSYMKVLFNFAKRRKYLSVNPLAEWQKKGEQPRRLRLTVEDLNKIYEKSAPHMKWVIKCVTNLGVRPGPSELFKLRWVDVDWDTNQVVLRSAKTGRERVIPFSESFAEELRSMHRIATTPFICEYQGHPIRKIRNAWRGSIRRSGVAYKSCLYDLRHLYATTLLRNGADLKAVSELLGHHSTKMTADVYYHCMEDAKRAAAQLVPQVGRTDG